MLAYLAAHWVAILTAAVAIASEIMPFLPTKANGIVQAGINVGKWVLSKKAPALKSVAMLPLVFVALFVSGCATSGLPAGATFQQKLTADEMVLGAIKNDIQNQCPKMAPVAGLVAKALAVAMNPTDVVSDIVEALAAVPELKQDYDAVSCAIKVVLADYKKYFKAAPTPKTAQRIQVLERALVMLGAPAGDTCVASR